MATKKKPTPPTPKNSVILTKEQFERIKQIASDIQDARINIEDLKGENNVNRLQFNHSDR